MKVNKWKNSFFFFLQGDKQSFLCVLQEEKQCVFCFVFTSGKNSVFLLFFTSGKIVFCCCFFTSGKYYFLVCFFTSGNVVSIFTNPSSIARMKYGLGFLPAPSSSSPSPFFLGKASFRLGTMKSPLKKKNYSCYVISELQYVCVHNSKPGFETQDDRYYRGGPT